MRLLIKSLLTLSAVIFLFGCATKTPLPNFEAKQFDTNMYSSKVDNFLILFDASSSLEMDQTFETARAVVTRLNQTIPEMGQTAGLRSFGHDPGVSMNETQLFYGMEKYSTAKLQSSFDKIKKAGGFSPINKGLDEAGKDLKGLSGTRNAIILVSDGKDMPRDVLDAAKRLKDTYKDNICFYTIHIGKSVSGKALLKQIADIGGCGFASDAQDLLTGHGMAAFVENALLHKKGTPMAPAGPASPMDSDQDGVVDSKDKCPDTPLGASVSPYTGCWTLGHVLFNYNKADIRAAHQPMLYNVVEVLEKNPGMTVQLDGHCDNIGSAQYNMGLSARRANAVKQYLVDEGIAASRVKTKAYGLSKPVATNDTDEGRALNRRVEITPMK
ncbi:MAG: OmpA family protein [Proteobacteria bacterium]|nr:OmpA family protein [Pseudomonadota bacterium]MBU1386261.1 OmpA family protein [Pseudomonadota bacterium]MBU1542954.1 OmpA family protein [Pseudomonadota bacterium]MBU2479976.1 OmpA family protein [Pseudomonadota bacterium]